MDGLNLDLSLGASPVKGVRLDLAAFMTGQSDGFWYDFASPDRMFQENTGPTLADGVGELVGLALSQRQSGGQTLAQLEAVAPEVAPPFLVGGAGWNVTGADATHIVTFGNGSLRYQSGTTTPVLNVTRAAALTAGRAYRLTIVAAAWVGGGLKTDGFGSAPTLISGPGDRTHYLAAVSTTLNLTRVAANTDITIDNLSVKEVSRYPATQATGTLKPAVQSGGVKGDGVDDRLTTAYAVGTGDNFLVCPKTVVPATLAATQVLAGAMDGSSNGWYLGITTGGALRAKVGQTTLDSTGVDLRGGTHDFAVWTEGATLYLYADGSLFSSAWTGSRPTTAWNLFALNNNATPSNFTASTIRAALAGRQALTTTLAAQICAAY